MIKFNTTNIFVGYIKQLLKDFNLPNIRIYNQNEPIIEKELYIKNNNIIKYINGEEIIIRRYLYNVPEVNYTRNLNVRCMHYDCHTHEYLGDYLRFMRDYNKLDLMSLYNCFSNNSPRNLDLTIKQLNENNEDIIFKYNTQDETYKIFMLPVKLFKKYTIAINSQVGFDMFCGFYGKSYYDGENITKLTNKRISHSSFDHPILWDDLVNIHEKVKIENVLPIEKDLKLFIKLPASNKSTITILEGDYRGCIDFGQTEENPYKLIPNYTVVNYYKTEPTDEINRKFTSDDGYEVIEYKSKDVPVSDEELNNIKFTNFNQLLYLDSGVSHPFSNRLMEYLSGNVITNTDEITDNIKRVQLALFKNYRDNIEKTREYAINEDNEQIKQFNVTKSTKTGLKNRAKYKGKWEEKYRALLYKIASEKEVLASEFDILGYLDKTMETNLNIEHDIYEEE